MTGDQATLSTRIPDLRGIPLSAEAPSGLAEAIRLYRERLKEDGVPLSSFNARI